MERIPLKNKLLAASAALLLFFLPLISGCASEAAKSTGDPITRVVFTRTGAGLFFDKTLDVTQVAVVNKAGQEVSSQAVNGNVNQVLLDFGWEPNEKYQFEIDAAPGRFATTAYAPTKPSPLELGTLELGEVTPADNAFKRGGCPLPRDPQRRVEISPDDRYVAIGCQTGKVHMVRIADVKTHEELWKQELGEDQISAMAFSADGECILVGLEGIETKVHCFDTTTGAEKWSYTASDDVGKGEKSPMTWPLIRDIVVDSMNRAFVAAERAWFEHKEVEGVPEKFVHFATKFYCFDVASGETLWVYPEETLDQPARGIEASPDGKYVLLSNGMISIDVYQEGVVYCLDGEGGTELWQYSIPVLYPFTKAEHHYTGSYITGFISPDGAYVTMLDHDGRVSVFDMAKMMAAKGKAEPLWEKSLSIPLVDGLAVGYTGDATIEYTAEGILLVNTGFTYAPAYGGVELRPLPLLEYSYLNCLFMYSWDGELLSRYRLEGYCPNAKAVVSDDGMYAVIPIGQTYVPDTLLDSVPRSPETHGLCIFDLRREGCWTEKLDWFFHTEGPVLGVDITSDGKHVVAIEVPVDMDPDPEVEKVVGSHRVHFLN